MYLYLGILVLLSAAAFYPVARGYIRRHQEASGTLPAKKSKKSQRGSVGAVMRRTSPKQKRTVKPMRRSFKAASVHPGQNCCQAVQKLTDTRYLLDKLPRLPLDTCDRVATCKCSFTNHPDRRGGVDRRAPNVAFRGIGEGGVREVNKRSGMDRRTGFNVQEENITFE